jgi:hypothetical protein
VLVEAGPSADAVPGGGTAIDSGRKSMTMLRRGVAAAALSLTAAVGGAFVAGTAHAEPATTGSLSFSGDTGDYISQGKSWSYSTTNGDALNVSSSSDSLVSVSVNAYNGDWWYLDIDAPSGQVLAPGTYDAAHRYPFNGTGPGLSLSGEGRGCNELTGSFTIINAVFGPQGYVQTFDATFEQHCEGGGSAARGELHISNQPPPAGSDPSPPAGQNPPPPTGENPPPPAGQDPHPPATSDPPPPPGSNPTLTAGSNPQAGPAPRAMARRATSPGTITSSPMRNASASEDTVRTLLTVGIVAGVVFVVISVVAVGLAVAIRRR